MGIGKIIYKKNYLFVFSALLILAAVLSFFMIDVRLGIEFTGGSLIEAKFPASSNVTSDQIENKLDDIKSLRVQSSGDNQFVIRSAQLDKEEHSNVLDNLKSLVSEENTDSFRELRFSSIGPSIGEELKSSSIQAIIWSLIFIILYVSWSFRKTARIFSSFKFAFITLITLFHDVIVTAGVIVFLSQYLPIEIGTPFVAGILTILGYSVNDTIVVFDRVRENILSTKEDDKNKLVGKAINDTLFRSINTSLTTLLALFAVYIFGVLSIQTFILTLIVGVIVGTYSSMFIASPLLTVSIGKE